MAQRLPRELAGSAVGGVRQALIALLAALVAEQGQTQELTVFGDTGKVAEEAATSLVLTMDGVEMRLKWGFILQLALLGYLLLVGWRWACGQRHGAASAVGVRSVQTQSQTTYRTSLQQPRFVPLHNGIDGAWVI